MYPMSLNEEWPLNLVCQTPRCRLLATVQLGRGWGDSLRPHHQSQQEPQTRGLDGVEACNFTLNFYPRDLRSARGSP